MDADLPFRVEQWDAAGQHVERVLALAANLLIAKGTFAAAVTQYPDKVLTLRHGARVVESQNLPA